MHDYNTAGAALAAPNGTTYGQSSSDDAPMGPVVSKKTKWLDLPPECGAEGMRLKVWVNYPPQIGKDILNAGVGETDEEREESEERSRKALTRIVLEHNGWCYEAEDGSIKRHSPASSPAFWEELSNELAGAILVLLGTEVQRLGNSLAPKPPSSRRR